MPLGRVPPSQLSLTSSQVASSSPTPRAVPDLSLPTSLVLLPFQTATWTLFLSSPFYGQPPCSATVEAVDLVRHSRDKLALHSSLVAPVHPSMPHTHQHQRLGTIQPLQRSTVWLCHLSLVISAFTNFQGTFLIPQIPQELHQFFPYPPPIVVTGGDFSLNMNGPSLMPHR